MCVSFAENISVQLKVVPAIEEVGKKFNGVALQISRISEVDVLVITGLGLTVTVTLTGVPAHPLAIGVIR